METPQEFCKRKGFTQEPPGTTSYYIMWSMMRMYAKYYHEQQVKSVDLADVGEREPIYNDGLRKELDRLKEKRDSALSSSAIRYWQREIDRLKKEMYV